VSNETGGTAKNPIKTGRARGKPTPTRIELQWSSLLVTKAWTRAAAALQNKERETTTSEAEAGASELVDVQGEAELLVKNDHIQTVTS